jgi:hypothetical protein
VPRVGKRMADEKLIAAISAGKSTREAAEAAGVSERTAQRRLADEKFKARVMEVRSAAVANATAILLSEMKEASHVLGLLLGHSDPRIQERAAVKVIELGVKLNAVTELERRLEQLEQFLAIHVPHSTGAIDDAED